MQETQVWSLSQKDPLEKGMTTNFSVLAWEIPLIEEPGGLQPMGSQSRRWLSAHACTGLTEGTEGRVWTCHRGRVGMKRRATGLIHLSWNPAILLSFTHSYHLTTSHTFSWDPFELPENAFTLPPHWSVIKCPNFTCMTFNFFLIGGSLLYNVVLVSAIQQCGSAISIHIYPLPHEPLSHPPIPHL